MQPRPADTPDQRKNARNVAFGDFAKSCGTLLCLEWFQPAFFFLAVADLWAVQAAAQQQGS